MLHSSVWNSLHAVRLLIHTTMLLSPFTKDQLSAFLDNKTPHMSNKAAVTGNSVSCSKTHHRRQGSFSFLPRFCHPHNCNKHQPFYFLNNMILLALSKNIIWNDDEAVELLSGMPGPNTKHPMVYSFNLPSTDGEVTGHLIQSQHCQLAHSEQENKHFSSSLCELCRMLTLWLAY